MPQNMKPAMIGKVAILPEPPVAKESMRWWYAEAQKAFGRKCPKCGNACTQGLYVPPHNSLNGECAVVNNCLLCGHEEIVRKGRNHAPLDTAQVIPLGRMTERPVKLPGNPLSPSNHHKKHNGGYTYGS